MLHQTRREINKPLWAAYIDLKAAFGSVDRNALWKLLTTLDLLPKILSLFQGRIRIRIPPAAFESTVATQSGSQY